MNIVGKKYGYQTVLELTEHSNIPNNTRFMVRCDCGHERELSYSSIKEGKKCRQCSNKKYEDLTGQRFGSGVVTRLLEQKKSPAYSTWELKCDCGNLYSSNKVRIISGQKLACTECSYGKNLINHTFGLGTVVRKCGKRGRSIEWELHCKCGNYYKSTTSLLNKGEKNSCGCLRNQKKYTLISSSYWSHLRNMALKRNLQFDITQEYALSVLQQQNFKCRYTNLDISITIDNKEYWKKQYTASIDRIDNNQGYVEGNIQWVHKKINIMRGALTNTEFLDYCCLVAKNYE